MNIALITPKFKKDYLADTIIDGLIQYCERDHEVVVGFSSLYKFDKSFANWFMKRDDFVQFAKKADLIIFINGKDNTDYDLANDISEWEKTVFVDGGELGLNRRLDIDNTKALLDPSYRGRGFVDFDMLRKCRYYFRREKPYMGDIIPFTFGIERKYTQFAQNNERPIDIVSIFGQKEYPQLRAFVNDYLSSISSKYKIRTKKTKNSFFGLKNDAQEKFYRLLSRSKIGISVSGGGYDTARFWEILGSNCILFTEKIDIYREPEKVFDFSRIYEFNDIDDFKNKIDSVVKYSQNIDWKNMKNEYDEILRRHSSLARFEFIIHTFFHG